MTAESDARLLIRQWRQWRATQTLGEAVSDGYVNLFVAVALVVPLINLALELQRGSADCTAAGCLTARSFAPFLAGTLVCSWVVSVCRLFGPVTASAPEGFFLLGTSLRRDRLLRGRLWGTVAALALASALLVGLTTGLAGSDWRAAWWWALAVGMLGAVLAVIAAFEQQSGRRLGTQGLAVLTGVATAAALVAVVMSAQGWLTHQLGPVSVTTAAVILAVAVIVVLAAALPLTRGLTRLRRSDLTSGGELARAMQGAFFGLDFGLMHDIVHQRRWAGVGHVRPTRGRGLNAAALTWRDMQRLRRNPRPLAGLVVTALVPYAVLALGGGRLAAPISAVLLFVALVPFLGSLRVLTRSKSLARMLPFEERRLREAVTVVPLVLMVAWVTAITPGFVLGPQLAPGASTFSAVLTAIAIGLAGFLAAVRWVTAGGPDFNAPLLSTGAGAIPPTLVANLIRGLDVTLLVTLPLLAGWSPWLSLAAAAIFWAILRSGTTLVDLQEQAQEAKREAERAKAESQGMASAGPKIAVQRKLVPRKPV